MVLPAPKQPGLNPGLVPAIELFIYGSLLSGGQNHRMMGSAVRVGPAATTAAYALVDLGPYPALLESGHTAVLGELYRVSTQLLIELDEFEGTPDLYRRGAVQLEDGRSAAAYFLAEPPANHVVILSGDWLQHLESRRA